MQGGPGNPAQKELTCLFNSIASFYHPSNHGRWQVSLSLTHAHMHTLSWEHIFSCVLSHSFDLLPVIQDLAGSLPTNNTIMKCTTAGERSDITYLFVADCANVSLDDNANVECVCPGRLDWCGCFSVSRRVLSAVCTGNVTQSRAGSRWFLSVRGWLMKTCRSSPAASPEPPCRPCSGIALW